MLLEGELAVEEEAQVAPKLLGFQGGLIRERSETEIDRAVPTGAGPSEMKQFVLVMLHDQARRCENLVHNCVGMPKHDTILRDIGTLGCEQSIVDVRYEGGAEAPLSQPV
jgi:hypothetical protein